MVEVPEVPAEIVKFVAANVNVPMDAPTVTVSVPVEAAKVESPEYVAVITCEPVVADEKV